MNLNPRTELAIKTIKAINIEQGIQSKAIALQVGCSDSVVRNMCAIMKRGKLLTSEGGPKGGYYVEGPISVYDLVRLFDSKSDLINTSNPIDPEDTLACGLYQVKCDIIAALYGIQVI